jgi:molybdate transport system substrate-binding protein
MVVASSCNLFLFVFDTKQSGMMGKGGSMIVRNTVGSLALLLALACGGALGAEPKITVAAAANMSSLGEPLKVAFQAKNPGVGLDFIFGASGALTTQIQNGAPFDLFMSADTAFPEKLVKGGFAAGAVTVYASGKLMLLSTKPLPLKERGLAVLADSAIKQFALANPETAPYGKAAVEALVSAGLYEKVKDKAVIGQNITQALQFTLTAAGVGFVNKSALYASEVGAYGKEGVNWLEVDPRLYAPIDQAFVLIKKGDDKPSAEALAFAAFLSSPEAGAIFLKYGYSLPR